MFQWAGGSSIDKLEAKLREAGMQDYQVDILVARFGDGKKLREIAKEQGWVTIDKVRYHLKEALLELKKRGFA